ncbi:hypothetical protein Bca4012_056822 [Brassica carinata]
MELHRTGYSLLLNLRDHWYQLDNTLRKNRGQVMDNASVRLETSDTRKKYFFFNQLSDPCSIP